MSSVEEIEAAIARLPREEFLRLRNWVQDRFEDQWDRQIAEDMDSGNLDALAEEALKEHRQGKTRDFPGQ